MTLYIWVVLAHAVVPIYGWQYAGQFDGGAACHRAAENLGVKQYRCIFRSSGEVSK